MKLVFRFIILSGLVALLWLSVSAQEGEKENPGKKIFKDNKCQSCHSIEAVGIKRKPNQKPPDLSQVGSEKKADFIAAYLKKKESLNGVKHAISFKGSDEELETLVTWLESLKGEDKKPKN